MSIWLLLLLLITGERAATDCSMEILFGELALAIAWALTGNLGMERIFGAWLSLAERTVRDREVEGSNPFAPIDLFSSEISADTREF